MASQGIPLIPGSSEVRAILAQQVDGMIAFQHDALNPQGVTIAPMTPGDQVTVWAGERLRLVGNKRSKPLTQAMRFAVIFDVGGLRLAEVSVPDRRILGTLPPVEVEVVPEGTHPRARKPRPAPTLTVAPEPPLPAPEPETTSPPAHRCELAVRWLNDVLREAQTSGIAFHVRVEQDEGLPQIRLERGDA